MAHALDEATAEATEVLLYRQWRQTRDREKRLTAIMVSLGLHGLRCKEIADLSARDLDRQSCRLIIHVAKATHTRTITVDPRFAATLQGIPPTSPPLMPLDPLIYNRNRRRYTAQQIHARGSQWLKRNIGPYSMHSLRKTAAVRCWNATHDILAVMRTLGHRSLRETHVYLQSVITPPNAAMPQWMTCPLLDKPKLYKPSRT